jgi:hypothetical protein
MMCRFPTAVHGSLAIDTFTKWDLVIARLAVSDDV